MHRREEYDEYLPEGCVVDILYSSFSQQSSEPRGKIFRKIVEETCCKTADGVLLVIRFSYVNVLCSFVFVGFLSLTFKWFIIMQRR